MSYYSTTNISRVNFRAFLDLNVQGIANSSDFTTTSLSFVDITGLTTTKSTFDNGKYMARSTIGTGNSVAAGSLVTRFNDDGVAQGGQHSVRQIASDTCHMAELTSVGVCDGTTLKMEGRVGTATGSWKATGAEETTRFDMIELGGGVPANLDTTEVTITADFSSGSTSYIDITGLTMSKTNLTPLPRIALVSAQINNFSSGNSVTIRTRLDDNGTPGDGKSERNINNGQRAGLGLAMNVIPDGTTIKGQGASTSGTATWMGTSDINRCAIKMIAFAGGFTHVEIPETLSAQFTTTSAFPTYVDVTDFTMTRANIQSGKVFCIATINSDHSISTLTGHVQLIDDTTIFAPQAIKHPASNHAFSRDIAFTGDLNGKIIKIQACIAGGGNIEIAGTVDRRSKFDVLEVRT